MQCNWSFSSLLIAKLICSYGASVMAIFFYIVISRKVGLMQGALDWVAVVMSALVPAAVYFISTGLSMLNAIIGGIIFGLGVVIYYFIFMLIFIAIIGV